MRAGQHRTLLRPIGLPAAAILVAALALSACGPPQSQNAAVPEASPSPTPIMNSPCDPGSSGVTLQMANNTGLPDGQVNWFVQQQTGDNPELVAGPFNMASTSSLTCSALTAGQVVVTLGTSGSVTPPMPHTTPPQPKYTAPSPDTEQKRFQIVEMTYPGVANLTAVQMYGIPIDISGSNGKQKVWKCYTDVIKSALKATLDATPGANYANTVRTVGDDPSGAFLRLVSPNIVSGLHPTGYPDFTAYLSSLAGKALEVKRVKGVQYSPFGYDYTGTVAADGSIALSTTDTTAPNSSITIPAGSLTSNNGVPAETGIYGNNSPYYLDGGTTPHYVGENDFYAAVYRDVVAGFSWGFWNANGPNNSFNFNADVAPGPFSGAQPSNKSYYNAWAAALWPVSGAYGFAFEDTFNPNALNPAVPIPTNGTLTLTIQPDVTPASNGC